MRPVSSQFDWQSKWQISGPAAVSRAADRIIDDFRQQILSGTIARGTKLPTERELCAAYGVSAVTVRAAMRALATGNLIEVRQGSGSYVTAPSDLLVSDSLRSMIQVDRITAPEIMFVLGALYSCAVEQAAITADEEDIQTMLAALDAIDASTSMATRAAHTKHFLDVLARSSGSLLLASLCKFLSGLQVDLTVEIWDGTFERFRRLAEPLGTERRRIVQCILEKDPKGAREAALAYHVHARELLLQMHNSARAVSNPMLRSLLSFVDKSPNVLAASSSKSATSTKKRKTSRLPSAPK